MHILPEALSLTAGHPGRVNRFSVCFIAAAAALGGFLFGYDWVVIGGAKPFYESYFGLHTAAQVGWANSCALIGCLLGALASGIFSRKFGRRQLLALAAFLFTISAVLTGWSYSFGSFVTWRILGGFAIGIASSISPTYIAEISPGPWRGRLVTLNQLALVIGILAAQLINWQIARPFSRNSSDAAFHASWNVQYGWRWMFSAVAVPGIIFLISAAFIPESPRWLMTRGHRERARASLGRLGDTSYAEAELVTIQASIEDNKKYKATFAELLSPAMRRVLVIGIALALLQQWCGINILFNYAEEVYRSAGYGTNGILFNIVITGTINLIFTLVSMACVDRFGRRTLMLLGCAGVGLAHIATAFAYWQHVHGPLILFITLAAIAFYAASLAPVTWVLITEIFPNRMRSMAVSVSVMSLWVAAFLLTYTFPLLTAKLGIGGTFFSYALLCFAGGVFVYLRVPETKGCSLEETSKAVPL